MNLESVRRILNCTLMAGENDLSREVETGCGADLMSDVLAFIKPRALLLTGLTSVQSVRTADVAEVIAIVYVRGKLPDKEAVELAKEKGIAVLVTELPMFEACGRLYSHGLSGVSQTGEGENRAGRTPVSSAI